MRTLLLTLMLLPTLLSQPALAAPPNPPPPVFAAISAVTMTAFLDKPVYQRGQPIVLEVDLHNTEARAAVIGMTADQEAQFHILITEASGRIVPRTALGDLCFAPLWAVAANAPVEIKPGATRRCRFNLTDLYGLLRTGHYSIAASRTLGPWSYAQAPTVAAASPLKFQIVQAAASPNAPATPFVHDPSADENIP